MQEVESSRKCWICEDEGTGKWNTLRFNSFEERKKKETFRLFIPQEN